MDDRLETELARRTVMILRDCGANAEELAKFQHLSRKWRERTEENGELVDLLNSAIEGWMDARFSLLQTFRLFCRVLPTLHAEEHEELAEEITHFMDEERAVTPTEGG